MSRFALLLGGKLTATPRLRKQIAGARVIAADSGMAHAAVLGLAPELWVGDFDSTGAQLAEAYRHVPRQVHPVNKDTADGDLAIAHALDCGATEIVLVGGFGGQADHMLAHFGQIVRLALAGTRALISSGDEEAYPLVPGKLRIELPAERRVSLIPFLDFAGLDLSGVKWPLLGRDVPVGSTLTLSNVTRGAVTISLRGGYGVAIAYPGSTDD